MPETSKKATGGKQGWSALQKAVEDKNVSGLKKFASKETFSQPTVSLEENQKQILDCADNLGSPVPQLVSSLIEKLEATSKKKPEATPAPKKKK